MVFTFVSISPLTTPDPNIEVIHRVDSREPKDGGALAPTQSSGNGVSGKSRSSTDNARVRELEKATRYLCLCRPYIYLAKLGVRGFDNVD